MMHTSHGIPGLICVCCFAMSLLWGQPAGTPIIPEISIRKFTPTDGFDYSSVSCMIIDSLESLWILGPNSHNISGDSSLKLTSWDGARFSGRKLPVMDGLSALLSYHPFVITDDRIVFQASTGRLFAYDPVTGEISDLLADAPWITSVRGGETFDSKFYFIGNSNGESFLGRLDQDSIRLIFRSELLASALAICPVEQGVWVCVKGQIVQLDENGQVIHRIEFDDNTLDDYGIARSTRGIEVFPASVPPFILDPQTSEIKKFPFPEVCIPGQKPGLKEDASGNSIYYYWATYQLQRAFLVRADGKVFDISAIRNQLSDVRWLQGVNFLHTFWIGTPKEVFEVRLGSTFLTQYLPTTSVRKIRILDNDLIVSTDNNGIFLSRYGRELSFSKALDPLYPRYLDITPAGDTIANTYYVFYIRNAHSTRTVVLPGNPYDIIPFGDSLFVASSVAGFVVINKNSWEARTYPGVKFPSTHQLLQSGPESLFIAYQGGLTEFNITDAGSTPIFTDAAVTSITNDTSNASWLGTAAGGLLRMSRDGRTDTFEKLVDVGSPIVSITPDHAQRLWLGTYQGIYVFDLRSGDLLKLNNNFLPNTECNRLSAFYDTTYHRMMIGTINGLSVIDIDNANLSRTRPDLHLSYLRYYNRSEGKTDTVVFRREAQYSVTLDAQHRNLTVGFAPGVSAPANCTYYYTLVREHEFSLDTWHWTSLGNQAEAYFPSLRSGKYKLFIKAKTDQTQHESEHLMINILVRDYFYHTWWFYTMSAFLLGAIVYGWQRHLRKENIRLEREVDKRTSELKKDKETIQSQAEELTQLDEMKTRFYNNISHDLKTPLALIVAPMERLLKDAPISDTSRKELLQLVGRNAHLLEERVEELLELTRLENKKLTVHANAVSIPDFIAHYCDVFKYDAGQAGIELVIDQEVKDDYLLFDDRKTGRVVQNLIANALKYCPAGSRVATHFTQQGTLLLISVEDNGPGIPVAHQSRIFDKFYQVSTSDHYDPGSGIGLSIVKEYVELMHGSIRLTSAEGEGTRFDLAIPVRIGASMSETVDEIALPVLPEVADAHVLVVEDNPDLRQFLYTVLSERFEVTVAVDGSDAMRILGSDQQFDLILSDIMMPKVDGMDLLAYVRNDQRLHQLPFIFLTAKQNEVTRLAALRLGVDDYLTKPFSEHELLLRILRLLRNLEVRRTAETEPVEIPPEPEQPLSAIQHFIESNLTSPTFSVEMVAQEFEMSARSLQRMMRRETGLSPNEFIIEVRMNLLRQLRIEYPDLQVKELAGRVGYTDPKHMAKVFFERFGYRL